MATVNPYLNFGGNAEEAFNFYRSVFGGEFRTLMRFGDVPPGTPGPPANPKQIMHVALPIGKNAILMGSDTPEAMGGVIAGSNFSVSVETDSEAEATKIFNGLSAGGKVTMPLEKTFWGAFFGMCTDKFGINWMVDYTYPQQK